MVESPTSIERTFPPAALPERRVETRRVIGKFAFLAVGLLLLTAATLKLVGLNFSPFAQYGWLLTPTVQTAAVVWEIALGVWLLLNQSRFFAWLAALGTFLSFAVVSGYLGFLGQANCGCFGLIQASPWAAFAVDMAALVLLAFAKPTRHIQQSKTGLLWLGGVALALIIIACFGSLVFGSLESAVARLRGQSLISSPEQLEFGIGEPGQMLLTSVTIRNISSAPVRLVGGTSDCSCITTQDMPIAIPPGESVTISIKLKVPAAAPGLMTRRVELFTDSPNQQTVRLTAICRVE